MRFFLVISMTVLFALSFVALSQQKTPPHTIVFKTKMGNVTYDHVKHLERAKKDCNTCHDKLFPQSQAPLTAWKTGMHKAAEKSKTSCGACHNPSGPAFGVTGNCNKCHVKG
jgi:c(7)-type cytochrome triheme protein